MRAYLPIFLILALISASFAYTFDLSREEILQYYYANIDYKVPKSAKMLIGNENVNVHIGGKVVGIKTKGGELSYLELSPVANPSIVVRVSNYAAKSISAKEMGLMDAIEKGGIEIECMTFFGVLKVEALKRVYSLANIDSLLTAKKAPQEITMQNSMYVHKVRFWNSMFWN